MTSRTKLLALLVVQALLTVVHLTLRNETETWSWHSFVGLGFGLLLVVYAFCIRCPVPTCRAGQVFRGWSAFDVRLPREHCYNCGALLNH